jgi:hypothetical protein
MAIVGADVADGTDGGEEEIEHRIEPGLHAEPTRPLGGATGRSVRSGEPDVDEDGPGDQPAAAFSSCSMRRWQPMQ